MRNFRGDVLIFILDEFARLLFGFATSDSWVVVDSGKLFIQCVCGKSLSDIFCTQTNGCSFKSNADSLTEVGDLKNVDRVDMLLSVRSKIQVVVVLVLMVVVDAAAIDGEENISLKVSMIAFKSKQLTFFR